MSKCRPKTLRSGEVYCDSMVHTHPERSLKAWQLNARGCYDLLMAICRELSDGSRVEIAKVFDIESTLRERQSRKGYRIDTETP